MKESEVEARLVRGVQELGGLCWKFVSPGRAGVPDRVCIFPDGRVIFVELKTADGRLRPLQVYRQQEMVNAGAPVRTLYGFTGVDRFLEEVKRKEDGSCG